MIGRGWSKRRARLLRWPRSNCVVLGVVRDACPVIGRKRRTQEIFAESPRARSSFAGIVLHGMLLLDYV